MHNLKQCITRCFIGIAVYLITFSHAMATDPGASIRIGQPGFYGEIQLGDYFPLPELIYPEPVIINNPIAHVGQQPVYLHVPPGHAKQWQRFCLHYNACNRPVYFVRENWYNNVYVPQYHQQGGYQQRRYETYPHSQYDSGRHYQDRQHDSHRHYDNDHHNHGKHRDKNKNHRYGYEKHDGHGNEKHDRGRGKKHDH